MRSRDENIRSRISGIFRGEGQVEQLSNVKVDEAFMCLDDGFEMDIWMEK